MEPNQELLDKAIQQITLDLECGDSTAIEELLKACPEVNLQAFLREQ